MTHRLRLFSLGWLLVIGGSWLAHAIQTSGGVTVADIRFAGEKGTVMSALLYTPANATTAHRAPAVLVSHGYINTREMQSPFAIELSRRGFVVLAMDMSGHGYSGGAVGANGGGGPAALKYLRSLPVVDTMNIGLEGHSMGGAPMLAAAQSSPDGYKAIVLEGSSPVMFRGVTTPPTSFPRNLAVVMGEFDEFAPLMWQVPKGSLTGTSARLIALFGASDTVVEERIYGDIATGSGRVLYMPPVIHPREHFANASIGAATEWFQRTLAGAVAPKPATDQIWIWKEVGTLIAFAGFVILMLGAFQLLLAMPVFAGLAQPAKPTVERRNARWWIAAVLTSAVPALTLFPFMKLGGAFYPMQLFPQSITNRLTVWAVMNGIITFVLGFVMKQEHPTRRTDWSRSIAIALATVGVGYLSLVVVDILFTVDFRFWVLGLKLLDPVHAGYFAAYLVPWTAFFLVTLRALNTALPVRGDSAAVAYLSAALAMSFGFIVLLAVQYWSLFTTGVLAIPTEPLNTIVAIQFVPLLAMVGLIAVFTCRHTNSYIPGAIICAVVITWYIVAGSATHWSPDYNRLMTAT